ncbi:MAG: hypothetical protein AB1567_03240 [bacterium]
MIRLIIDVVDTPTTTMFFAEYKEVLKERFKQIDVWITASPIQLGIFLYLLLSTVATKVREVNIKCSMPSYYYRSYLMT